MTHTLIVELIALAVGITVIIIETVIIFMLRNHIKELNRNAENNRYIMDEFKKSINSHLEHLDNHSHDLDEKIEKLFTELCKE